MIADNILPTSGSRKTHSHHQYVTISSSTNYNNSISSNTMLAKNSKHKYTTRHLAALDFLFNIPMQREYEIRQNGLNNAYKVKQLEEENDKKDQTDQLEEDLTENLFSSGFLYGKNEDFLKAQIDSAIGKKLKGPATVIASNPITFRYQLQRLSDQSAIVRHWEDLLLSRSSGVKSINANGVLSTQPILSSRIFYSRARSYPSSVFSVIKYDPGEEKAKIEKMKAEDQKGLEVFELPQRDWRGFSYKPLFKPIFEDRLNDYSVDRGFLYEPNLIDDPNMLHGNSKNVLTRTAATGPIISSIILFVNKKDLKQSLNEQYRERHPNLPPSLTLSKIRNIKKHTVLFCLSINIEISTVAIAVINFERLCIKGLVTKMNRKLTMAVSLLLAYKFNENSNTNTNAYRKTLELLLGFFDREWEIAKKQVFEAEFGAYVHLGFSLHIPYNHIHHVYLRLLKLIHNTSKQYLGDDMNEIYMKDIFMLEREIERVREEKEIQERIKNIENEEYINNNINDNNDNDNNNNNNEEIIINKIDEKDEKNDKLFLKKSSLKTVQSKLTEHLKKFPSRFISSPPLIKIPSTTIPNDNNNENNDENNNHDIETNNNENGDNITDIATSVDYSNNTEK